jgi:hypothetical protein
VSELPEPVRAFLDANIFSASQLEVLLLLRERGAQKSRLSEISRVTALPQSSIGPWLDAFVSRGLLGREDDLYWFSPADAGVERLLDEVADTWRRRKTTVTRYIYASTQDPLIRFADAFRLRRSDPSQED